MTALAAAIQSRILALREQRVMLDADLAELYGVQTKVLVQAVKRNLARFPEDFMFQLSPESSRFEVTNCDFKRRGRGGRRTAPYAFTPQGVAMLSSVLGSPRAIAVNIEIMRTFVRVRALAATHGDLAKRLSELEQATEALAMSHDTLNRNTRVQFKQVFDALRALMTPPDPPKRPIGFVTPEDKGRRHRRGQKARLDCVLDGNGRSDSEPYPGPRCLCLSSRCTYASEIPRRDRDTQRTERQIAPWYPRLPSAAISTQFDCVLSRAGMALLKAEFQHSSTTPVSASSDQAMVVVPTMVELPMQPSRSDPLKKVPPAPTAALAGSAAFEVATLQAPLLSAPTKARFAGSK